MRIVARSLYKYFGRFAALKGVGFSAEARRIVVVGQNSSGKPLYWLLLSGFKA